MMQIIERSFSDVCVDDMEDGQIAIITNWGSHSKYAGTIVQRYGDHLITLAADSSHGWTNLFLSKHGIEYQVKILQIGTVIRITAYDKSSND